MSAPALLLFVGFGGVQDYNYRSYAKRRVKLGFQQNKAAAGDALVKEYQEGVKQLNMLKRCVRFELLLVRWA